MCRLLSIAINSNCKYPQTYLTQTNISTARQNNGQEANNTRFYIIDLNFLFTLHIIITNRKSFFVNIRRERVSETEAADVKQRFLSHKRAYCTTRINWLRLGLVELAKVCSFSLTRSLAIKRSEFACYFIYC